ncbi:hypothetical protein KAT36_02125 [Candidatus Pacearchaeota archaeon]|nr:hypothetical protein [Candidatus Pacearchaeota archaeon]
MENRKLLVYVGIGLLIVGLLIGSYFAFRSPWKFREDRPIRILWLNSYHEDMEGVIGQIQGFKASLEDNSISYEIKAVHMDTKQEMSEEERQEVARESIKIIEKWKPDIIYASDDNAQKYVGVHYLNNKIPWVFSGMNGNPEDYGYSNSINMAGVLERELVNKTFELLQNVYLVKKIGIIGDDSFSVSLARERVRPDIENIENIEIIGWYFPSFFEDYKEKIKEYNEKAEAILIFATHTIKYENREIVPVREVMKWTVQNSQIPEFSFWDFMADNGVLFSVQVSFYNQGYRAGELAKKILIDGERPIDLSIVSSTKEDVIVNLARANMLGLKIKSSILVNSEVIEEFPWDKKI